MSTISYVTSYPYFCLTKLKKRLQHFVGHELASRVLYLRTKKQKYYWFHAFANKITTAAAFFIQIISTDPFTTKRKKRNLSYQLQLIHIPPPPFFFIAFHVLLILLVRIVIWVRCLFAFLSTSRSKYAHTKSCNWLMALSQRMTTTFFKKRCNIPCVTNIRILCYAHMFNSKLFNSVCS